MTNFVASLKEIKINFKSDIISGFLIFLLALPLSLGIAKASGFPASMGILTAIIGGLTSLFFKVSSFTIKGPAAGLITICSGAIMEFGSGDIAIQICCTAVTIAAILQIGFAYFNFGKFSDFFPYAAVKGMLATIGIIIISKQIPVLLGVEPDLYSGKNPIQLFLEIPIFIQNSNITLAVIGVLSIFILIFLPKIKWFQKIPSPVIILLIVIPFTLINDFRNTQPFFALVDIGDFWSEINISWNSSFLMHWSFWKYVLMFLFINSLESLLTVKAIDNISDEKKTSDYNADLKAVGFGNFFSSLLGGLPLISEVVRSTSNIKFGAKSKWSNFFHGIFLLISILFFIPLIESIPNSALAAMLIFAGYNLCAPKHFIQIYKIGKEQLLIYVFTIIITLLTDLLVGIFVGILIKILIHLYNGAKIKNLFILNYKIIESEHEYVIYLNRNAVFCNVVQFKSILNTLNKNKNIVINAENLDIIDHSFLSFIENYKRNNEFQRSFQLLGMDKLKGLSNHPFATRIKN
ncbi:MAG: hypothetical protein RLZZ414_30 [Bacteroidota bacterium]|jgi:MFS superfamily sulfate permease-like transporter